MTLEEYKRKAKDYLLNKMEEAVDVDLDGIPNCNQTSIDSYLTRIEKESEMFFNDSWDPEVMVQAMTSGLV